MSERPRRVLLLEDSKPDAELLRRALGRSGMDVIIEWVHSEDAFRHALSAFTPDVVLSDHSLAQFDAQAALRVVQAVRPTIPVIVVAGVLDEQTAVACLRAGAEDLVLKSNLDRIGVVIEAALAVRRPLLKLSPRQIEVLRLLSEGHSRSEIARRLQVGVKTVETHKHEVMKRLDIHDSAGLVRYAVRVGLVPPELRESPTAHDRSHGGSDR